MSGGHGEGGIEGLIHDLEGARPIEVDKAVKSDLDGITGRFVAGYKGEVVVDRSNAGELNKKVTEALMAYGKAVFGDAIESAVKTVKHGKEYLGGLMNSMMKDYLTEDQREELTRGVVSGEKATVVSVLNKAYKAMVSPMNKLINNLQGSASDVKHGFYEYMAEKIGAHPVDVVGSLQKSIEKYYQAVKPAHAHGH